MARRSDAALERVDPAMLAEVRAGLSAPQKKLPPKYFYDRRGSELFEEITRLPEYYLTRAERALLVEWAPALVGRLKPRALIELGAGSAAKSRILLDAMRAAGSAETYVPIDVSALFLRQTAAQLSLEYPGLTISPAVADVSVELCLPPHLPHPSLYAFLGSTIGNFHPAAALRLLRRVHAVLQPNDRFLLGVDLRKDVGVLEAAYNDAAGVTAEFNRNVLLVLNAQLGADFDPAAFAHRAFYRASAHRIEMHLVARSAQEVMIPGIGVVSFADGESIRTEISCKYDRAEVESMFADAGLGLVEWRTDAERRFALALAAPVR
jgi:L-histidine N-alpha-methyltransferase